MQPLFAWCPVPCDRGEDVGGWARYSSSASTGMCAMPSTVYVADLAPVNKAQELPSLTYRADVPLLMP